MNSVIVSIFSIVFGFISMKYPPSINRMVGYKSPLALKNQDTWNISQKHSGFIAIVLGVINGIFGIWSIIQPMAINKGQMQLLLLLISVVLLVVIEEIHLAQLFNMDGSRKNLNNQ
ncbi:SdpI family protein [Clostridium sp. FP1]|uniref:SdpI family protein n=1 Tax=Clostridium sp. FP1 TaxID=2724076 RepID=UPI0013E95FE9|nr:SdpI family protein [Clostridium sp. FP1]MBZ9637652.1 SdpI family protein [Clostridium sp. FP1]